MRNEGQFILEWVAYFRTLGFDEILVMTNDCDDGSDKMLDRLEKMGELMHIDNTELDDLPPPRARHKTRLCASCREIVRLVAAM